MTQPERPTGRLYSSIYLRTDNLSEDSSRFRKRVERLLTGLMTEYEVKKLTTLIESRLGVSVPQSQWGGLPLLRQFVEKAASRDLLDTITLATLVLDGIGKKEKWIAGVGTILSEQQMAYEIDEDGGIHPFVDPEFSASKQATLRALVDNRFATARERFEQACDLLRSDPSSAIEQTFKAAENIFKQICNRNRDRLNARGIKGELRVRFYAVYSENNVAVKVADQMCESFAAWVNAAHNYRHDAGETIPIVAPFDIGVLMVSQGAAYIRWMAENFDALREGEGGS